MWQREVLLEHSPGAAESTPSSEPHDARAVRRTTSLAVVDLEDGARSCSRSSATALTIAIDGEVELVLRRYSYERGVPEYGYKARPLVENTGAAS